MAENVKNVYQIDKDLKRQLDIVIACCKQSEIQELLEEIKSVRSVFALKRRVKEVVYELLQYEYATINTKKLLLEETDNFSDLFDSYTQEHFRCMTSINKILKSVLVDDADIKKFLDLDKNIRQQLFLERLKGFFRID